MYAVIAIAGRPVLVASHDAEAAARREFAALQCPSLIVRVDGPVVDVLATHSLGPAQVDRSLVEAVKRVCRKARSTT